MGNRQQDTGTGEPKRPRGQGASADTELTKQRQRDARQSQSDAQDTSIDRGDPDQVEIGDPVPEDDRTIRARGRGETGEDEDLPGTSRRGETGEDEDLPDDDAGIERASPRTDERH